MPHLEPLPDAEDQIFDAVDNNWVDSHAPYWSRPFLKLSRMDRPIGTWLLLLPCWWGLLIGILSNGSPRFYDLWILVACAFGAVLMKNPKLVAACCEAMKKSTSVNITVKCRIGVDDQNPEQILPEFLSHVSNSGVSRIIIHARKAILSGLSPKENREIPPLHYGRVLSVKENFPELEIVINGGITTFSDANCFLQTVDGVMIGREAYQNPFFLSKVDEYFFNSSVIRKERAEYLEEYIPYIESELKKGTPLKHMTRHLLGLFKGQKGGKQFRRHLSENAHRENAGIEVIADALKFTA